MDYPADTTIPDEFCDQCNAKINLQRVYYNGRRICPTCYGRQISQFEPIHIEKCPKCGYELNGDIKLNETNNPGMV